MKGSLIPLGTNYWRLRCYTGERTASGNPRQASKYFRGTKKAAEKELRQLVDDVESGRIVKGDDPTVRQLLERWMENAEHAQSTRAGYRSKIEHYLLPAFGDTKVAALRADVIDRNYRAWEATGLAPATVRQVHAILSGALAQAVKWGWVERNQAKNASPPSVHRENRTSITSAELGELIAYAIKAEGPGGVLPVGIALGALTGCRRGELCALRWSDVGAQGAVVVKRSLTVLPNEQPTLGPTKTHQERAVGVGATGLAILACRRESQEEWARQAGVKLVRDAFILSRTTDGAEPCMPDGLSHGFARLVDDLWPRKVDKVTRKPLGEPRWHFHDLRHYAATQLVGAGMDVRTVAGRLGHADASTTLRVYAHALAERDTEAAVILGAALPAAWGIEARE